MTTGQQSGGLRTGARTGGMRRPKPRFFPRRKVCTFCMDHVKEIDYKDVNFLRKFTSDQFKIESRRKTGTCSKHQRALAVAIKRARQLSLMPLTPANKGRGQRWMAG